MTLKEIIVRIKQNNQHTPQEIEVATLLFNLGLKFIFSNKKIFENKQEIGEVDLCFLDELEGVLFIIEVSKQNKNTSQKVDHFFSKWSDKKNLRVLYSKYNLTPRKIIKINFDLFPRDKNVDITNKRSLEHIINDENVLIGVNDFQYFSKTFSIIDKWAKNDFYNYLGIISNTGFTEIDAIVFKTGNDRAYVLADKVSNILRYSYISRRRDNENGYQRMVEQGRIGSILKTIKRGKTITFPNSIILNSNSKLLKDNFKLGDEPKAVKINIPSGFCCFRVIDGQHRLMGFAKMGDFNRNDYSLPVVILETLDKSKEIQTFIEINHKQKRLDSNLILSLKADFDWEVQDKEFFEKISVLIARELINNSELKNNIYFGYADEKKGDKITITTLHSALLKNNLIGLNKHIFQTDNKDHLLAYKRVKSTLSSVAKIFKLEKKIFLTNVGIRILFRYVQIFERNISKGFITKTFEDNLTDLKKVFPKNSLIESIKEQYGEGGANKAVDILFEKLKESNPDYVNLETDLRKL